MLKVTTSPAEQTPYYPRLVQYTRSGNIVLLTSLTTGTLVKVGPNDAGDLSVGYYSPGWSTYLPREEYTGAVTLENTDD